MSGIIYASMHIMYNKEREFVFLVDDVTTVTYENTEAWTSPWSSKEADKSHKETLTAHLQQM